MRRYAFLIAVFAVVLMGGKPSKTVHAAYYPIIAVAKVKAEPISVQLPIIAVAKQPAIEYRAVPEEIYFPDKWTDPWQTKERVTFSWKPIIDDILAGGEYPNVDYMLILGMIAQESGGYLDAQCNDFDTERGTCAVGLMAVSPAQCGFTEEQLKDPVRNVNCGIRIINTVYNQAIEHGFEPGREATRAALAAYNCSWPSVLANRCFSFGGFAYADIIGNYWFPLLEKYATIN
ncbi:hypothetical protein LCGC14_1882150 [marine sediment metagenome]|uniref:Transglycosylase SLT domain-containing protein n=1 Tax=marine sediment metagenome TaxID=412755 RepID=A0A0F9G1V1_9ZZZZ